MSDDGVEKEPIMGNSSEQTAEVETEPPEIAAPADQSDNETEAAEQDAEPTEPSSTEQDKMEHSVEEKEQKDQTEEPSADVTENSPPADDAVVTANGDDSKPNLTSPSSPVNSEKPVKPPRLRSMRSKDGPPPHLVASGKAAEAEPLTICPAEDAEANLLDPSQRKQDAVQPKKKIGLDYIIGNKWIILGIIAVVLVILIILIVGISVSRKPPEVVKVVTYDDPKVYNLKCGGAVGAWEHNHTVAVFKGIPYLRPPVGSLRWSYSLAIEDPSECKATMVDAKQFKGPCFQSNPKSSLTAPYIGSEDCLYLNVWTPNLDTDKGLRGDLLPVLVYIHGGFLNFGSGHEEGVTPSAQLAKELNAVVVSFNYRLNVFGWLALKGLTNSSESDNTGNYGFYDQQQALKWVYTYIHEFGGDPNQVTLSGLSSGGTSVYAHLVNDESRRYFRNVWISGASSKFDNSKEDTLKANSKVFLRNYGCESKADRVRECLISKSSQELFEGIPWIQYPSWAGTYLTDLPQKDIEIGALLINDGTLVPESPTELLKKSKLNISYLIGNTEYESDRYQVTDVGAWTWAQYADYLRSKMDSFGPSVSDDILTNFAQHLRNNPKLHFAKVVSDLRATCPQTFMADTIRNATSEASIYRYVMTEPLPASIPDNYFGGSGDMVATHGTDLITFFYYSDDISNEYKKVQSRFRSLIKEFMLTGSISSWTTFPAIYNVTASKDITTDEWSLDKCEVWRDYYPYYSWMN